MGRSKLISSNQRRPKKRVRVPKSRAQPFSVAPQLEPGAPSDLELMKAIQAEDPDALAQLYDRYNGILKALILRVIHNEAEADDLLQEIFMEIWNQAKNFSSQKGKPLGWMVTLARRRAIDGLRKQQAIDLAYFQGMSKREIAAKTNTPLDTVKTRLELGLKKIYDGLKELRCEL